jgi:CRP-like cAMP-binding protein
VAIDAFLAGRLIPSVAAPPLFEPGRRALTDSQRRRLAADATRLEVPARKVIYREGDAAEALYITARGVVMAFSERANGKLRVAGFRFPSDLFGLSRAGVYVNTTRAITPATIYRIPVGAISAIFADDPAIEFQFLCKVVDELRTAQRKSIIVARRDAAGRLAMFAEMLFQAVGLPATASRLDLPMSKSDIAGFLNLTLESVSRATHRLRGDGIVDFGARELRILDRGRFDALVDGG